MGLLNNLRVRLRNIARRPVLGALEHHHDRANAASQLALQMQFRSLVASGAPLPSLRDVGFQVYSQSDEDGILLFLFTLLRPQTRKSIEICAGNGIECNTANLIINHGWSGLLVDGNAALVEQGRRFYAKHKATYVLPPLFEHAWITRENVNAFLKTKSVTGEMDLLSLDLDGIDYWVWEALDAISPRIVVLEFNPLLGPERSATIPYSEKFDTFHHPTAPDGSPNYYGASLTALVKLSDKKGYRLIGCNRWCYNAFFVKKEFLVELPTVSPGDCFRQSAPIPDASERFETVRNLPWVEI